MSTQKRAKSWGYEVELQALKILQQLVPDLERTGASAQKSKGYPDLMTPSTGRRTLDEATQCFIVTKDKGRHSPMLVTLPLVDLIDMVRMGPPQGRVAVQVKARKATWIGSLWAELRQAVRALAEDLPPDRKVWLRGGGEL